MIYVIPDGGDEANVWYCVVLLYFFTFVSSREKQEFAKNIVFFQSGWPEDARDDLVTTAVLWYCCQFLAFWALAKSNNLIKTLCFFQSGWPWPLRGLQNRMILLTFFTWKRIKTLCFISQAADDAKPLRGHGRILGGAYKKKMKRIWRIECLMMRVAEITRTLRQAFGKKLRFSKIDLFVGAYGSKCANGCI